MRANQKLTHLIAGRSISGTAQAGDVLTVTLDDGSVLTIKTAPSNTNAAATSSGKIIKVQQQGTDLAFVLDGGKTLAVKLAEETSSVMMRDKAGGFAYSD